MPIRFSCSECGQRLNARDDKIGKQLRCPKCRTRLTVPAEDELSAAEATPADPTRDALRQLETELADDSYLSELVVYDDDEEDDRRHEFDLELVSFSRRVLYVQAGLLAAMVLFGLAVGFLIGRGTAPTGVEAEHQPVARDPVRIQGNLQFSTGGGARADRGGVVIALPAQRKPEEKIPVEDLVPQSQMPHRDHLTLQQIGDLGGDYARAGENGNFALHLVPGTYHLLYLSYGATRPGGVQASREDLAEIGAYFQSAYDLIGRHQYRWQTVEIDAATQLAHTFRP